MQACYPTKGLWCIWSRFWNSNGGVVTQPDFAFMSASEIVYTNGG